MIPANTPRFKPSEEAIKSSYSKDEAEGTLIEEWFEYVKSVFPVEPSDNNHLKELFDYNINNFETIPINLDTLNTYSMLAVLLNQHYFNSDFIGFRISKLFNLSEKSSEASYLVYNIINYEMCSSDELDALFENKSTVYIDTFYSKKPIALASLMATYLESSNELDDDLLYLFKNTFDTKWIEQLANREAALLNFHIRVIKDCELVVSLLDKSDSKLSNLFILLTIIDLVDSQNLSTDPNFIKKEDLPNYKKSKTQIDNQFEQLFPTEYTQYQILKNLELSPTLIWSQLTNHTGIIDGVSLPQLNF